MFENQDQTVPQSQRPIQKLSSFKPLSVRQESSEASDTSVPKHPNFPQNSASNEADASEGEDTPSARDEPTRGNSVASLIENFVGRDSRERVSKAAHAVVSEEKPKTLSKDKQKLIKKLGKENRSLCQPNEYKDARDLAESDVMLNGVAKPVEDFNQRIAEQQPGHAGESDGSFAQESQEDEPVEKELPTNLPEGVLQNAFDRMRPRRNPPEVATITIGPKTTTSVLGASSLSKRGRTDSIPRTPIRSKAPADDPARQKFSSSMRSFAAPGSQLLKTVGKPQSKSRASINYFEDASDDEVSANALDANSARSGEVGEQEQAASPLRTDDDAEIEQEGSPALDAESDEEYLDEESKKSREEARVAGLIRHAEEQSAIPSQDKKRRAHLILKGTGQKDSTASLVQVINVSVQRIEEQLSILESALQSSLKATQLPKPKPTASTDDASPEERLSLTVSKEDFAYMRITGQFNLGFILATRANSDLFIIDQHASDEKHNFERLQATTVVQNQRLVHPRPLHLTAIEEEVVFENNDVLLKNGFLIDIDTSGESTVGQRCKLLSLPMSREVTFDVTDLEELIALLADTPTSSSASNAHVPRPGKVRRMFAMRACRSSIMIGKTLTLKQMGTLVRKMGDIEKPWNCPHGRPTMRHVCGLGGWRGWEEGDGVVGMEEEGFGVDWRGWVQGKREEEADVADENQEKDMEAQSDEAEGEDVEEE